MCEYNNCKLKCKTKICLLWTDLVAHPGASDLSFPLLKYGAVNLQIG